MAKLSWGVSRRQVTMTTEVICVSHYWEASSTVQPLLLIPELVQKELQM